MMLMIHGGVFYLLKLLRVFSLLAKCFRISQSSAKKVPLAPFLRSGARESKTLPEFAQKDSQWISFFVLQIPWQRLWLKSSRISSCSQKTLVFCKLPLPMGTVHHHCIKRFAFLLSGICFRKCQSSAKKVPLALFLRSGTGISS